MRLGFTIGFRVHLGFIECLLARAKYPPLKDSLKSVVSKGTKF